MKKIMYNERFCLQQATLDGTKTMTRRIVPDVILNYVPIYQQQYHEQTLSTISVEDAIMNMVGPEKMFQRYVYQVGEVVAVAQRYQEVFTDAYHIGLYGRTAGWTNKMYVEAELMPRHIKITDRRLGYLQDISDEDCLKEGITFVNVGINHFGVRDLVKGVVYYFYTPYQAYKYLIDRLNKRGFFETNPLVFVYGYEIID